MFIELDENNGHEFIMEYQEVVAECTRASSLCNEFN